MAAAELSLDAVLPLLENLATQALCLWNVPNGAEVRLINVSENVTYLVEAPGGYRSVMRVHRENYHSRQAIESELTWLDALGSEGRVATPRYYLGQDGRAIQECRTSGLASPRFVVLFHFIEGSAPDEIGDMIAQFEELGAIAAQCHLHTIQWAKPSAFERLIWDVDAVFGSAATWGNWRDAPHVTPEICAVLEQVETTVRTRLASFGKAPERFNLIHADMRLANLLVSGNRTRLIDFDDSGFGWFMYDFAAAISFIEDDPRVPALKNAWLRGYRNVRALTAQDEAEIDTLIMLRRMALLAWIGSHIEAPEPQNLAADFAETTAALGQTFLDAQD